MSTGNANLTETITDFILLGSKFHRDGYETKKLLTQKKDYDNFYQNNKMQKLCTDNKGMYCHGFIFPVGIYCFERWTINKVEQQQQNDASEL